mgnify:CR=1 FL=1|jgi:6,7-dimethyl-8-ribityllumazine synthase
MKEIKGLHSAKGVKIAIVASEFNSTITNQLVSGARDYIERSSGDLTHVIWVPGAFELPLGAKKIIQHTKVDAVIALGCVIRGETPHFDFVCSQSSSGIISVSLEFGIPVSFGVLTTDSSDQALERSGLKGGNKGAEAAETVIKMISIEKQLKE